MSQENVEIVRAVFDAAASRDRSRVLSLYDPDVEFDVTRGGISGVLERTVYHGHDGLRRLFRDWYEAWESAEDVLEELIDTGDHVVSVATIRGHGRASGIDTEWSHHAAVWTIRDGKVVRVVWFPSRREALEAAGLSE